MQKRQMNLTRKKTKKEKKKKMKKKKKKIWMRKIQNMKRMLAKQ